MLLAIDTATRMLSLALHDGQQIRAELSWQTANAHTIELAPAVVELCQRVGIVSHALTRLAVAQGPGSFSGLRIGIGFAKGLALALSIPLIPIPTLDIVAAAQPIFKGTLIAVAQVGRGRVCAARYQWRKTEWVNAGAVEITEWLPLIASVVGETLIVGEIDEEARDLMAVSANAKLMQLAKPALAVRRAAVLADLAWARATAFADADPAAVAPLYVNQPGLPHA